MLPKRPGATLLSSATHPDIVMLKFTLATRKMKAADLGRAKGHNLRTHDTASQLPAAAWFSKQGCHSVVSWNDALAEKATSLAKRKDAVVGIELVVQVGNQTDWRDPPSKQHPNGKPKRPAPASMQKLTEAVRRWLAAEFGPDNVISVQLHTDESTPHVQCVIAPIRDGKLNAKHWMDGAGKLAKLRERAHRHVSRVIPCEYEKGAPGGLPHDPGKAAGATLPPGMFDKLLHIPKLIEENAQLKARIQQLEQVQFSREKRLHKGALLDKAEELLVDAQQDRQKAAEARREAENELREVRSQRGALEALKTAQSGKLEIYQRDALYYEQTATELMAKNDQLAAELAAEREKRSELAARLAEYEPPTRRLSPGGSSAEPGF